MEHGFWETPYTEAFQAPAPSRGTDSARVCLLLGKGLFLFCLSDFPALPSVLLSSPLFSPCATQTGSRSVWEPGGVGVCVCVCVLSCSSLQQSILHLTPQTLSNRPCLFWDGFMSRFNERHWEHVVGQEHPSAVLSEALLPSLT